MSGRSLQRACLILLIMCTLVGGLEQGVRAQEVPVPSPPDQLATPSPTPDPSSRAFEFYPAESGFGSFFNITAEPGDVIVLETMLANTSGVDQELRNYAVDAYSAVGGGFAAAEYGTPPNEVTSWIEYPEEIFEVKSGTGVVRSFTVTVPKDVSSGQYISAVAAQHAESLEVEGSTNFRQIIRYVIPVFITVPGNLVAEFEIGDVHLEGRDNINVMVIDIINKGNMLVRPEGEVQVLLEDGRLVLTADITMDSVYAGDSTTVRVALPLEAGTGPFSVKVVLSDPATMTDSEKIAKDVGIPADNATPVDDQGQIQFISAEVLPSPDSANVQFAVVNAKVFSSADETLPNAQLSLVAYLDGQEVERFPVVQALSLQPGETPISTRYIPATGWTSGAWTFELLIETVEPGGAAVVVARQPIEGSITIP